MSGELFRTNIVTRDPRYPSIIAICNYALAGLFLGMFFTLSGVMLTSVGDKKTGVSNHEESKLASILGLTMLVSGCLLIIFALATFMVASLMYLKTTTTPPQTADSEEVENVWTYLDSLPDKASSRPKGSTRSTE